MADKTEIKPEEPAATPGAATSVEHIAPEDQYAAAGKHQEQKQQLKKECAEGRERRGRKSEPRPAPDRQLYRNQRRAG